MVAQARLELSRLLREIDERFGALYGRRANRRSQCHSLQSTPRVLTGIDVLARDGFKQLSGMRIGLVTNHTGRDVSGRSTIDVLYKAPKRKTRSPVLP